MSSFWERKQHVWTSDSIMKVCTPSDAAKSMFFYVQEVGHLHTFHPYFTEREHLNSYLIIYTLRGKGVLTYQGERYEVNRHQVLFIDCMSYQKYEAVGEACWEVAFVHLNGSSIGGYYQQYSLHKPPVLNVGEDSGIPEILQGLLVIQKEKGLRAEAIASQRLTELLTLLLLYPDQHIHEDHAPPPYISLLQQELEERYTERITLEELARAYSRSKFVLSREFKRYIGISLQEYIILHRITAAKNLLKHTELTVTEIAAQVGIDNPSHFINLFKAREELTPLAYRKRWNEY